MSSAQSRPRLCRYDLLKEIIAMEEFLAAIRSGNAGAVREMIDRDPSLVQAEANGMSVLLLAAYNEQPEIAELLAERGAAVSFCDACVLGRRDIVERELASDASIVNRYSADGFAPVALAAFFRHRDLVELLIARGADVNAQATNAQRVGPLHAAAARQDHETVELLLEAGADANAKQASGFTPLHTAAFHGDRQLAELLLRYGADANATTDDGNTAVEIASSKGHWEFAGWLRQTPQAR